MLIIDSCLHFCYMFTIGFSLDDHKIYSSHRRRMNPAEIAELLLSLQRGEFKICKGLRQKEYLNSIAKDVILLYITYCYVKFVSCTQNSQIASY